MVAVRHVYNGWLEDVSPDEARRLLRLGLVELDGQLPEIETAMVAPPESAMLSAAKPRRRRVKRG